MPETIGITDITELIMGSPSPKGFNIKFKMTAIIVKDP